MRRGPRERVDLSIYVRAVVVFVRNPTVVVMPLLVAVLGILLGQISGFTGGDALTGGLASFILLLPQLFALGVSIIIADAGWRRGVASFDDAWQDARRKAGDIIFAAFGFTFVLQIALLAGQMVGALGTILSALAVYGLIFAIPAAAIGGVPGGAAINASVERVRGAPLTAAVLAVVTIVLLLYFGAFVGVWIDTLVFGFMGGPSILGPILGALVSSIAAGYVATAMAGVYAEVAFSRW
jgi:hypothetical protein